MRVRDASLLRSRRGTACGVLAIVALIAVLPGCRNHPWYLVESSYGARVIEQRQPEVTTTRTYEKLDARPTVAIRAPDRCANRSAAEATGEAASAGDLLRITCGVEMAELERALVKAGYRVISWSAIEQMVLREQGITPLKAAETRGAEVLFQVNSLERSQAIPGQEESWNRRFYASDKFGTRGQPVEVPEERARALELGVREQELSNRSREQISVTANVTAMLVATGEAIWFYDWTVVERIDTGIQVDALFLCHEKVLSRCFRRQPAEEKGANVQPGTVATPPPRSGGYEGFVRPPESVSEQDAVYYSLIQEVVGDLVREFTEKRGQ